MSAFSLIICGLCAADDVIISVQAAKRFGKSKDSDEFAFLISYGFLFAAMIANIYKAWANFRGKKGICFRERMEDAQARADEFNVSQEPSQQPLLNSDDNQTRSNYTNNQTL